MKWKDMTNRSRVLRKFAFFPTKIYDGYRPRYYEFTKVSYCWIWLEFFQKLQWRSLDSSNPTWHTMAKVDKNYGK